VSHRFGIGAVAALTLLLGSTQSSRAQTGCIGYCNTGAIVGGIVGISAGIATVGILLAVNHSHHTMKGCIFEGADGLELRTSDSKNYALGGDPAGIKVGDMVKFHGSKVKKTKDSKGDQVFKVERLKKDYGPCRVTSAPATGSAP
jgi:hypothetical protein